MVKKDDNEKNNEKQNTEDINTSYINPPIDNTSNNYKNFSEELKIPDHEIVVVDSKYICTRHSFFCFREGFSNYSNHTLIILDNENKEILSCQFKKNKAIIFDRNNNPILNTTINVDSKIDKLTDKFLVSEIINISEGKNSENSKYGIMRASYTLKRYTLVPDNITYKVEFLNLINNKKEQIEIRSYNENSADVSLWKYYVFCNPGEENEALICKICKKKTVVRNYTVEIVPGVDYIYMLSFCVSLCKSIEIYNNRF